MAYNGQSNAFRYSPSRRGTIKCKFGVNCERYKNGNCHFLHIEQLEKTKQIRSTIKCRFGAICEHHKRGICEFWHPEQVQKTKQIRSNMPCKYGIKCEYYKQGKCEYFHSHSQIQRNYTSSDANLYVKNLSDDVDDAKLRELFQHFGIISSAKIMREASGKSRGFGFIVFQKKAAAIRALHEMNNSLYRGKPLYVTRALVLFKEQQQIIADAQALKTKQIRSKMKCKFGIHCKHHKDGNCEFLHEIDDDKKEEISRNTQEIRSMIKCKFGVKCKHYKEGNCEFLHDDDDDDEIKQETPKKTQQIRSTIKCKFGLKCKHYKEGNCEFLHEDNKLIQNKLKLKLFEAEMEKQRIKMKYETETKLLEKEKDAALSEKLKIENEKNQIAQKLEQESKAKENILNDIKKKIRWQWKDDNASWNVYDDIMISKIEKLNNNESYTFTLNNNNNKYQYMIKRINKDNGLQINLSTNKQRAVRRVSDIAHISNFKNSDIMYPKWWNMQKIIKYAEPVLISLDLNQDPIAIQVIRDFATTSNRKIVEIESIQNQMLFDKYWNERRSLLKLKNGDESKLNEKRLFHGTKYDDIMRIVQKEGFRKEFTEMAVYGEGTYFARDSNYSVNYASNNNGIYKMFQCLVLCGESSTGNSGYKLKTWPKKQSDGLMYDSLVNNIFNPSIYVIHDDVRAYPMFIIHFK